MIEIMVDANPIMASLIGGVSRDIFFDKFGVTIGILKILKE